jgi:hypothetical protein
MDIRKMARAIGVVNWARRIISVGKAYKWDGAALCGYTVAGSFTYHSDSFFGVFILRWHHFFVCLGAKAWTRRT